MNHYFDKRERYQIIYPYESNKQYNESDLNHGVYKCYQELMENGINTYIFIIHNIDSGNIYYFNIPKNKHLENMQPQLHPQSQLIIENQDQNQNQNQNYQNQDQNQNQNYQNQNNQNQNNQNQHIQNQNNQNQNIQNQNNQNQNLNQNQQFLPAQSIIPLQTVMPVGPINQMQQEYDRIKQNEIITRLNRVEYQLDVIQKEITKPQKTEDDNNCSLM
jgi:hypothetical protein